MLNEDVQVPSIHLHEIELLLCRFSFVIMFILLLILLLI